MCEAQGAQRTNHEVGCWGTVDVCGVCVVVVL